MFGRNFQRNILRNLEFQSYFDSRKEEVIQRKQSALKHH